MNRSTREIERDVERTRSDIEDTVEALRDKMSIGQIVDEASHYLRQSGGSEALSNLATQARNNPMPLVMIGIGLAWLMSGRGQPSMGYSTGYSRGYSPEYSAIGGSSYRGVGARVADTAGSAKDAVSDTGRKAGEAIASGLEQVGDTASQAYGRVSDTASRTYDRVSDTAAHAYDRAARAGGQAQRTVSDLIETEPLILAGLGLAVGAAIGAMIPATEAEERLMGEKLDEWKEEASEMARDEWEKTKSVAKDAVSAAKAEVEKGGTPSEMADRAAKSAARTAEQSASDKGLGSSVRKS
jgi:ElaB/YqjD/DUF883 family membrane-anchored ribosome-binding protein